MKKPRKAARKVGNNCILLFSRERIPLRSLCVPACKNTYMQIPLILVTVRDYRLERTKGIFFKIHYHEVRPKLELLSFFLEKTCSYSSCNTTQKTTHRARSVGQHCCQLLFRQSPWPVNRAGVLKPERFAFILKGEFHSVSAAHRPILLPLFHCRSME